MSLDVTVKAEWPSGLCLLGRTFAIVNSKKKTFQTNIEQPVVVTVPEGTKAVQVAVINADMCFGESQQPTSAKVKSIWFEVSEYDDSELAKNKFKFLFKAWLQDSGSWTGFFVLDIMCFGEPRKEERKEEKKDVKKAVKKK